MAHTIFHTPDREDVIRRRTPTRSIEQARTRRRNARRAVLEGLGILTPPSTQTSGTGQTTQSQRVSEGGSAESAFGGGRAGNIDTIARQSEININPLDALAASQLSTDPRVSGLGFGFGLLAGPFGAFVGGLAGLGLANSGVGGRFDFTNPFTGNTISNRDGNLSTFRGGFTRSFRDEFGSNSGSDTTDDFGFGIGDLSDESFSSAGFDSFGEGGGVGGQSSEPTGGFSDFGIGDLSDSSFEASGFGGFDFGGDFGDGDEGGTDSGSAGGSGGVGEGGGIGL